MSILNRKALEEIGKLIDINNPKYELNYLLVDKSNVVSTNTKALCVVKHYEPVKEAFLIHGSIVKKALTERKATDFVLSKNKIVVMNDNEELMTYSLSSSFEDFKYPDYERIFPKGLAEECISFTDNSQISGICALSKVHLNPKHIPKLKSGTIKINTPDLPVLIEDGEENIKIIVMPIVDKFKEFENEGPF
ncbi:MAG: hypothetical protein HRT41_02155 [Campylobacteraceae bacterium]|nr:hypothetical protein [Campylobacteraceae bacterium]